MVEEVVFNYSRLRGRIIEKYGTVGNFANAIKMSDGTMSSRLSCKSYFSQDEIVTICRMLDIGFYEIDDYFFTVKV